MSNRKKLTLWVDQEVSERAKRKADAHGISVSQAVEEMLRQWISSTAVEDPEEFTCPECESNLNENHLRKTGNKCPACRTDLTEYGISV